MGTAPHSPAEDIASLLARFRRLPPEGRTAFHRLLAKDDPQQARDRFLSFVRAVWPSFIHGSHHDIMAETFERLERGELRRAIINLPPRHTKSMFASVMFPSWYLGRHPDRQIMECSHTVSLAQGFGRQVRNLIATPEYRQVFPGTTLSRDAKAAGNWSTGQNGRYFAVGTTGAVAGRGADLVIIDDPHSEQDVIENSKAAFERAWQWYLSGPRQRLQPGAAILVVMTRWGATDLTGQLVKYAREGEDVEDWELIQLPAILPSGQSLWPAYWPREEMLRTKATIPLARWSGQYMQSPVADTGALIKREWWKNWPSPDPPQCKFVVMAWDTAFSDKSDADRSACVVWGEFEDADDPTCEEQPEDPAERRKVSGIILLDAYAARLNFPDLKQQALKFYKEQRPHSLIVEGKATGTPLVQELRKAGLYVEEMAAHRGHDKTTKTNAVADMFSSGAIWAPMERKWAQELVEEMAAFPHGEFDDLHDAAVMGLLRIRQGGFRIPTDAEEEPWTPRRPTEYY